MTAAPHMLLFQGYQYGVKVRRADGSTRVIRCESAEDAEVMAAGDPTARVQVRAVYVSSWGRG